MTQPVPDDAPVPPQRIPRGQLALALLMAALRLALGGVVIAVMLTLAPEEADVTVALPLVLGLVASALYIWFFRRQMRGVSRARYPMIRAGEALVLSAAMFLALFAMSYVLISTENPAAFSEPLNSFSAYYFALTVLATVGFGDIAPNTVTARSVTMVQMALDIAFIAVTVRVMSGAARKALAARDRAAQRDTSAVEA
jgi:hypothetical protein